MMTLMVGQVLLNGDDYESAGSDSATCNVWVMIIVWAKFDISEDDGKPPFSFKNSSGSVGSSFA